MKKLLSLALVLAAATIISTSAKAQLFYDFSFTSDGMNATGTFGVLNGVAVSGSINITGVPLENDSSTLINAAGSLVPNSNFPGTLTISNHDGDNVQFDNAVNFSSDPIFNGNGLAFASGQYDPTHYETVINLWGNSTPGSYSLFIGEAQLDQNGNVIGDPQWVYNQSNGTLVVVQTASPTPEPSSYVLLLVGLGALAFFARRKQNA